MFRRISIVFLVAVLLSGVFFVSPSPTATKASASQVSQTYLVLFKQEKVPSNAAATIANTGGSLTYAYDEIGVAIAQSSDPDFRSNLIADNRVQGISSTQGFVVQHSDEFVEFYDAASPPPGDLSNSPVSDTDPLSSLQWDMVQIHTLMRMQLQAAARLYWWEISIPAWITRIPTWRIRLSIRSARMTVHQSHAR